MATKQETQSAAQETATPASRQAPLHSLPAVLTGDRRSMPADFSISLFGKGGTDQQLLHPPTQRRQSMRGFDETYVDIVDFIVRVTHRIWEEKDIGYIYDTYRHNAQVTDDYGLQYGRDKIVADTIHKINAFPDIRIFADEMIWAGNEDVGFYTSHRGVITGHNSGYSKYGPPTGRKIVIWAVANCTSIENEFFQEFVLYNNSSMLGQLGFDLREKAREIANQLPASSLGDLRMGEVERLLGQGKPPHLPDKLPGVPDVEDFIRRAYHYIWNWRLLSRVDDAYVPNLRFHGATDREYYGRGEYKSFILSMIAMFPDLVHQIDDIYWMGNEREGYLVSVRWSVLGTHRGYGIYGPPTGRRVHIWGINQEVIKGGKIVEEWMLFNEFEVMQQIYRDEPFVVE
jgi:predicted ester cyclase